MLRITPEYNVTAAKSNSFFSWDLLKGVSVAAAIHAVLFLGIHIRTPTYHESFVLLAPVTVEIDLGTPRTYCTPLAEQPIEPFTLLEFLPIPPPIFAQEEMTMPPLIVEEPDFSEIEYTVYRSLPDFEEEKRCLQ